MLSTSASASRAASVSGSCIGSMCSRDQRLRQPKITAATSPARRGSPALGVRRRPRRFRTDPDAPVRSLAVRSRQIGCDPFADQIVVLCVGQDRRRTGDKGMDSSGEEFVQGRVLIGRKGRRPSAMSASTRPLISWRRASMASPERESFIRPSRSLSPISAPSRQPARVGKS